MNVIEAMIRQKEIELEEIKKDKKNGISIRINPNSYVAKEIQYQTCFLKRIDENLREIKMLLQKK